MVRKFDLSCSHYDHNILKIKLMTLVDVSGENQECLKGIEIQLSDGTAVKTSTETGEFNNSYELDLGHSGRHILYGTGVWVADSLDHMLSTSFILSDGSIVRFPFGEIEENNQLGTDDYDGPSQNSVLDVLPKNFHAHSIRMIGITGDLLESSSLGDNVIANIAFKYVCQYPYCK